MLAILPGWHQSKWSESSSIVSIKTMNEHDTLLLVLLPGIY